MAEHFPDMFRALGSIPVGQQTEGEKKKTNVHGPGWFIVRMAKPGVIWEKGISAEDLPKSDRPGVRIVRDCLD